MGRIWGLEGEKFFEEWWERSRGGLGGEGENTDDIGTIVVIKQELSSDSL